MKKTAIIYGLLLAAFVVVLKTLEYKWLVKEISQQIYILMIALFFMALGVWLSYQLITKKQHTESKDKNLVAIKQLGLSPKELQVLEKVAAGLSNQAIANELFVSINTIKTHLKNSYAKLSVSSRINAINKLKELNIVE